MDKKDGLKEPGYYVGLGIAIGSGAGVALGTAFGDIALGLPIGIAIGVSIGAALEQQAKSKGQIRELTHEEKSTKKRLGLLAFLTGLVVAVVSALIFLLVLHK